MPVSITDYLESKEKFLPLLFSFLDASIAEHYKNYDDNTPQSYAIFYERFVRTVMMNNVDCIFKYSESPIERIFLNSLILLFIRNGMPCLHFAPPAKDVLKYIDNYRNIHLAIMKHIDSYKNATGDHELLNFDNAVNLRKEQGIYTEEEVEEMHVHNSIIQHFEWNSYKITLQAGFPELKIKGKSLRTDLFIWVPSDDTIKIVVECDGFAYHNSKESFQSDRQRDRLFQLNGFRVIRFSGAEINKDPAKVSNELFDLLEAIDPNNNGNRIL